MSSPDLCSKQGNSLSAVNDFCSIFIPTSPYVFRSWHLQTEVKQQQPEKRFRGGNLRKRQASHLTFKLCYWLQSSHQSYLAWPNHVGRFSVGSSKSWNGFPFQVSSEAKAQAFRPYTLMAPLTVWPVNLGKSIASVVTARASMTFFDLLSKTPANAAAKIEDLGHPYNLAGWTNLRAVGPQPGSDKGASEKKINIKINVFCHRAQNF